MLSKSLVAFSTFTAFVVADSLSLYLGSACNGADEGYYSPIPLGECIAFNQASSYILDMDEGSTYNLYSGDGCQVYEGQVQFSGCLQITNTGPNAPTHLINVGPQGTKRSLNQTSSVPSIRGRRPAGQAQRRSRISRRGKVVQKRVDGDTYQCQNIPYFFVVTESSTAVGQTTLQEEINIEDNFDRAYRTAYNQGGQTTVRAEATGDQGEYIYTELDFNQDDTTAIDPTEAEDLMEQFIDFRTQQGGPVDFMVSIYTGVIGHPDNAGPLASLRLYFE